MRFLLLFTLLYSNFSTASDVGSKRKLRSLTQDESIFDWRKTKEEKAPKKAKAMYRPKGNLPGYMIRKKRVASSGEKAKILYPELKGLNQTDILDGDIFRVLISQDIVGYVGATSPVKAEILNGEYKGGFFIGNATLDPTTNNVLVHFNKLRLPSTKVVHSVNAHLEDLTGKLGLKGIVHSKYWQHFFATVLARGTQGYADALVQRDQTLFGGFVTQPNPENAGKRAVAEGMASTADLLEKKLNKTKDWAEVRGPVLAKVFISDEPLLKK